MPSDFYAELGVSRDADEKQIKTAFRRLARKYHPDVNPGDGDAEARFKRVNEAYQVLSDAGTRRDYDEFGDNWKHADQIREAGGAAGFGRSTRGGFDFGSSGFASSGFANSGFANSGFGGLGLDDLFSAFGGGSGRHGAPRRQALRTTTEITLEEAYAGTKRVITVQGQAACRSCGGSGIDGTVLCATCGGQGVTAQTKTLEVTIPAGTRSGDRIRIRPDELTDVTITVNVRRHARFERRGDDLIVDVDVSYLDALLGGEVEVPTLNGRVALTIPGGTVEGKQFRLKGRGMPRRSGRANRRSGGSGDLIARAAIQVPEEVTPEERDLLERLRAIHSGTADGSSSKGGGS